MITNAPDTTDILNPQKTVKLCLTVCYFYLFFFHLVAMKYVLPHQP